MSRSSEPDGASLSQIDFECNSDRVTQEDDSHSPHSDDDISPFERNERERLCQTAREIQHDISMSKDPTKVYPKIRELYDMYYENYHHRRKIGDALSEVGFGSTTYRMLNALREKGFTSWKNRNLWKTTHDVMDNLWNYTNDSAQLANDCAKSRILEAMRENLRTSIWGNHGLDPNPKPKSEASFMLCSTLSVMNNIARRPENKVYFKKDNCFHTLMKYKESSDNFVKVVTLITLAYIADAREAHLLTQDAETIQTIVQWMNIAIDQDPKKPMKEGFTASELALALEKLSIDGNTEMILENKALNAFQRMLDRTILNDQISAAKCIWSLGMNEGARKRILKEKSIIKSLERMKEVERNKELLDCVGSALWTLKDGTRKPQPVDQSAEQHVFISYHERDKETVRKIWSRLRQENYEVWIDMEKMAGELLEAMSAAVDNSSVVILCISENYKQDNNCRSAARYTYKQEKQFIPLKMQRPFSNDGWLGMMTGTKTIYDFSDETEFEENMSKFLYDLEKNVGKKSVSQPNKSKPCTQQPQTRPASPKLEIRQPSAPIQASLSPVSKESGVIIPESQPPVSRSPSGFEAKEKVRRMTKHDVRQWLKDFELEHCQESFKSVDGKILWQLADLKNNPDTKNFYIQMLKDTYELSDVDILKLSAALDEIVEETRKQE